MALDTGRPLSRRALVAGALGAIGAAAAATLTNAQRVFAGFDDGSVIHVGDSYVNVASRTPLANQTDDSLVLAGINFHAGNGVEGQSLGGHGIHGSATSASGVGVYGFNGAGGTSIKGRKQTAGIAVEALIEYQDSPSAALSATTYGHGPAVYAQSHR